MWRSQNDGHHTIYVYLTAEEIYRNYQIMHIPNSTGGIQNGSHSWKRGKEGGKEVGEREGIVIDYLTFVVKLTLFCAPNQQEIVHREL